MSTIVTSDKEQLQMKLFHLDDFTNGWFIGNFEPTIEKTENFEIAQHFYHSGFMGTPHFHKLSREVNLIVRGLAMVNGKILGSGDIFVYEPNEISNVKFLDDTILIVIKFPSVPGDKYEKREE